MQKQFIESLKRDIDVISNEVSDLLYRESVFRARVRPSLEAKRLDDYSAEVVVQNHYSAVLSAVRRQLGTDKNEISLLRLLNKLEEHNNLITQAWYVGEWLRDSKLLASANGPALASFVKSIPVNEFEERFGKNGILDKEVVKQDIDLLTTAGSTIKTYVDKRIAHGDKTPPKAVKEEEYIEALSTMEKLAKKYILLLKQVGMVSLEPVIQG